MALVLAALLGMAAPGRGQEDAQAVVAFADGVRAFNEGRDQDAEGLFRAVVDREPRNGTARYWRGLALLRLGRAGEAREEIERGLRDGAASQAGPLWVRHDLGAAQLAAGDAAAASATLSAVATELGQRLEREEKDLARLERRLEHERARAVPSEEERGEGDRLEELEWQVEARRQARQDHEALLARALRRQGEALDRLGRSSEAAAARERAAALVPESAGPAVVAPPWEGDLPLLAAARPWEVSAGVETVADSNPSLLSEGLSLDTPDDGLQLIRGEESDQATQAGLRVLVNPAHGFGGWRLGAAFEGRQSFYQNLDFFNVGELRGVGSLVRGGAPGGTLTGPLGPVRVGADAGLHRLSFLLQGGVDYTTLDGSGYLTTAEGSASLIYRPSASWGLQADLHLQDRSYREEPVAGRRSGTEARLGLSHSFFWGEGMEERSLRLEVLGGERSAGLPFESSFLRGTANVAWPLPGRLSLALLGFWQKDSYAHPESDLLFFQYNPLFPVFRPLEEKRLHRQDTTLRAVAALSLPWHKVQWTARFAWLDRDSNLEADLGTRTVTFDYTRTLVSLGATWLF